MNADLAMQLLGLAGVLLIGWVLFSAQHDTHNKIDMTYLLVDPVVGNITLGKFGGLVALIASTWVIVFLAVSNHFDPVSFAAYLTAWAAVKIMADVTSKPKDGVSTTTTTERTTQVLQGAPVAGAPVAAPVIPAADPAAADDGSKTLSPRIEAEDVGKSVVIEPQQPAPSPPGVSTTVKKVTRKTR